MELTIMNPNPKYSRVELIEPTMLGYIHIGAEVSPRTVPFMSNNREKSGLLTRLKGIAHGIEQLATIEKITVYDEVFMAPTSRLSPYLKERADSIHSPRFDIVVLIETRSLDAVHEVQSTSAYRALVDTLGSTPSRCTSSLREMPSGSQTWTKPARACSSSTTSLPTTLR